MSKPSKEDQAAILAMESIKDSTHLWLDRDCNIEAADDKARYRVSTSLSGWEPALYFRNVTTDTTIVIKDGIHQEVRDAWNELYQEAMFRRHG